MDGISMHYVARVIQDLEGCHVFVSLSEIEYIPLSGDCKGQDTIRVRFFGMEYVWSRGFDR